MKIIITGATGRAGAEAIRQSLLHPKITGVTVLSRRPLPPYITAALPNPNDPRLQVVIHNDFLNYPEDLLNGALRDHEGCIWNLGISSVGMSEKEYTVITYEYAIAAARAFSTIPRTTDSAGEKFRFCYTSGSGATQSGSSPGRLFARVKGKTEKDLALLAEEIPGLAVYNFRPAGIKATLPDPVRAATFGEKAIGVAIVLLRPFGLIINADELARGELAAIVEGKDGKVEGWEGKGQSSSGDKGVWESAEIKVLAKMYST